MSSAPRSGQAAVSVAGMWLAGGSAGSQRAGGLAGGQRARRAVCWWVARRDWSAGSWAGGSEGGQVGQPRWALRRLAGGMADVRRVAGAWRRRLGGRSGGDWAGSWAVGGRRAAGCCEAAAQLVRLATAGGGSWQGRGRRAVGGGVGNCWRRRRAVGVGGERSVVDPSKAAAASEAQRSRFENVFFSVRASRRLASLVKK